MNEESLSELLPHQLDATTAALARRARGGADDDGEKEKDRDGDRGQQEEEEEEEGDGQVVPTRNELVLPDAPPIDGEVLPEAAPAPHNRKRKRQEFVLVLAAHEVLPKLGVTRRSLKNKPIVHYGGQRYRFVATHGGRYQFSPAT